MGVDPPLLSSHVLPFPCRPCISVAARTAPPPRHICRVLKSHQTPDRPRPSSASPICAAFSWRKSAHCPSAAPQQPEVTESAGVSRERAQTPSSHPAPAIRSPPRRLLGRSPSRSQSHPSAAAAPSPLLQRGWLRRHRAGLREPAGGGAGGQVPLSPAESRELSFPGPGQEDLARARGWRGTAAHSAVSRTHSRWGPDC